MAFYRTTKLSKDRNLQAYVIGLALGDGNLSNPNGRATRLRITCDPKYPRLIRKIKKSLKLLLPENKVNVIKKYKCFDVSVYSNHLEKLLGWKVGSGPKFIQKVSVPNWVKKTKSYQINCLKGLLETDGSVYSDRGYKMVNFTAINEKLARDVYKMMESINFSPHFYKVPNPINRYNLSHRYNVRLSKNVSDFLKIVKINKS